MPLTDRDVIDAFRMILGRPPEGARSIQYHLDRFDNLSDLRDHLLLAPEFQTHFWDLMSTASSSYHEYIEEFAHPRLVFLHIPKTAGTSMNSILEKHFPKENIFPNPTSIGHYPANTLAQYTFFRGHYSFGDIQYIPRPKTVFTIIRNPKLRLLSQYNFYRSHIRPRPTGASAGDFVDPIIAKAAMPLKDYLKDEVVRNHISVSNMQARTIFFVTPEAAKRHSLDLTAKTEMFSELPRDVAADICLQNLRSFDYVGVVEKFDAFARMILENQGITPPEQFEKKLVTSSLPSERPSVYKAVELETIDSETEELMNDLVAIDQILYDEAAKICTSQLHQHRVAQSTLGKVINTDLPAANQSRSRRRAAQGER